MDCSSLDSDHNRRIRRYHAPIIPGANHYDPSSGVRAASDRIAHVRAGERIQRRLGYDVACSGIFSAGKFLGYG